MEALEKAETAALLARSQMRVYGSFKDGESEWLSGKEHLDNGRYRLARRRFEQAIAGYSTASATPPPSGQEDTGTLRQTLTREQISNIADQARSKGLVRFGLRDFDNFVFMIASAVLAIVVMQVWNQIYPQLSGFTGGLWFITAFLIGFGSESLVGEAIEITRLGQRHQNQ